MSISERERNELDRVNQSGRQPVVFIHGLWLLPSSWHRWEEFFEEKGYAAMSVDWPGDADSVEAARREPAALAGLGVQDVAAHVEEVIDGLDRRPMLIGHSFGGLLAQMLAGRGRSSGTVAIDPAPFKGIRALPLSVLKATLPVLRNPLNRTRTVTLTPKQFRYAFANRADADTADRLYHGYQVAAPGRPLFQSVIANITPSRAIAVDRRNPERGPLLVIGGTDDNTVPASLSRAAYKKQSRNPGVTEFVAIDDAGHSLVFDNRWSEVAAAAVEFLDRPDLAPN